MALVALPLMQPLINNFLGHIRIKNAIKVKKKTGGTSLLIPNPSSSSPETQFKVWPKCMLEVDIMSRLGLPISIYYV